MGVRAVFRRLVEASLPWYDREAQERVDQNAAQLEQRLTDVLPAVEKIRNDYAAMGARLERRRR